MKSATIMRAAGESDKKLSRRFAFTVERLAGINPPASGRVYVYDTQAPHLAYMVTDKGATSYLWYGRIDGKPIRGRLGSGVELNPVKARQLCGEKTAAVLAGGNPFAKVEAVADESMTFGALFDWYETNYAKVHKSSWKNDRSLYDNHLKHLANRKANSITQDDLIKIHNKLKADKKPVTGNRLLSMVSVMYNEAANNKALGFKAPNPAAGITRHKERSRDTWVKTDAQLQAFIKAMDDEPSETMRDFFRIALLTGARRSNVLSMRWDEIDLAGGLWTIPAEKAKADENIEVPLTTQVAEILERRKGNKSEWVFPAHSTAGHLMEPKKAWAALVKRAGLPNLHLHDLRRTYASWIGSQGVSAHTIKAMLGHKSIKTTEIYLKANIEQMRKAAHSGAAAMQAAIDAATTPPAPAKVTKGKGKAAKG